MRHPWVRTTMTILVALALGCGGGAENDRAAAEGLDETPPGENADMPDRVPITISGKTFHLELAADDPSRRRGLMYREHIDPAGGMLFVFPEPAFQGFWMGWCLTDIDIIYLDPRGRVTATHQMTVESPQQPGETEEAYRERLPNYPSHQPAQFVIELAGGMLDSLTVAPGDTIDLDHEGLIRIAR